MALLTASFSVTFAQPQAGLSGQKAIVTCVKADLSWYDLQKQSTPVLQGQGWSAEQNGTYWRLPDRAKKLVRPAVWSLAQQSAGISVRFYSNASEIVVRYKLTGEKSFPHMPATGVSGLDLFTVDEPGKRLWCSGKYSFKDTVSYTFKNLTSRQNEPKGRVYQLFLPLYNEVTWMEIGLPNEAVLLWSTPASEKPIVVYGTSIAQGGCASRPGMAWTGLLNRELGYPLINLGFSGNGLLEKEVIKLINEIDARLYILDCLPNLVGRKALEIEEATIEAVKQIRTAHQTPILLVEHPGYTDGLVDKEKAESYQRANKASKTAFEKLKAQGIGQLFYLSCEKIDMPMDGMVDGIHPTDYGMRAYADAYEKVIREILSQQANN